MDDRFEGSIRLCVSCPAAFDTSQTFFNVKEKKADTWAAVGQLYSTYQVSVTRELEEWQEANDEQGTGQITKPMFTVPRNTVSRGFYYLL